MLSSHCQASKAEVTHAASLLPRGEDGQERSYRTPYQVGERQNAIVLRQEVGTKHATAEGQEDPGEGLVIFSFDLA